MLGLLSRHILANWFRTSNYGERASVDIYHVMEMFLGKKWAVITDFSALDQTRSSVIIILILQCIFHFFKF